MSTNHSSTPLVGITSCTFEEGGATYYKVSEKYMSSVMNSVGAMPVLLPSFGSDLDIDLVLEKVDGLLFTGSLSNVYPTLYGDEPSKDAEPYDQVRDETTLPLLKAAIERGVPTLCICRGFQELNVVLGGTLYPCVHDIDGRMDHRRPDGEPDVQYGPKHEINIADGGMFESMLTGREKAEVNSLHYQGVKDLAPTLKIEATAPDGTVEAVSMPSSKGFLFGVQWHPEYRSTENALSTSIFRAFARALKSA